MSPGRVCESFVGPPSGRHPLFFSDLDCNLLLIAVAGFDATSTASLLNSPGFHLSSCGIDSRGAGKGSCALGTLQIICHLLRVRITLPREQIPQLNSLLVRCSTHSDIRSDAHRSAQGKHEGELQCTHCIGIRDCLLTVKAKRVVTTSFLDITDVAQQVSGFRRRVTAVRRESGLRKRVTTSCCERSDSRDVSSTSC